MRMNMIANLHRCAASLGFALLLAIALPVRAGSGPAIEIPKHVPGGEPVDFVVIAGDEALEAGSITVTYRPGSFVESTNRISVPAIAAGEKRVVSWEFTDPGIARLDYEAKETRAEKAKKTVKGSKLVGVLFPSMPMEGLIIMILSALFLFGGLVIGFHLLSSKEQ